MWTGISRSNFFGPKDLNAFMDALSGIAVRVERQGNKVALFADTQSGDFPSHRVLGDKHVALFLPTYVARFLPPGEVAVFMNVGVDDAHEVTGWACAVDSEGRQTQLSLSDIYQRAAEQFGVDLTDISRIRRVA